MFYYFLLALLCLATGVAQGKQLPETPSKHDLSPTRLPQNMVVEVGGTVTIQCAVTDGALPEDYSIQWTEYAHTPSGGFISDNLVILPGHPQRDRYNITHGDNYEYSLRISPVVMGDGGKYRCMDSRANVVNKREHTAMLTVIDPTPNCTTTIRSSGIVLELSYQTNDCQLHYRGGLVPNMTWSGLSSMKQAYVATNTTIWAGMEFNVSRDMDTKAPQATTTFTGYFLPVDGNTADNVPTYFKLHQGPQMFVYWGPKNLEAIPVKTTYEVGDVISCTSDAYPPATYQWQNLRTNQVTAGQVVVIPVEWRGFNQSMRCEAKNTIEGTIYSNNYFLPVDVPPLTTPPTTTPTTTTTAPPAVGDCLDLTGAWVSTTPTPASLCIRLNLTTNGVLTGLLKNATDTFWVDIVGRSQASIFNQVGFNGIWPADIGVSSFIGECHKCYGVAELLVNVVSKRKGDQCGVSGETLYTSQYRFFRSSSLQCPNMPTF